MTNEQYLKNLEAPTGKIDVVLDTDAYNEIDDQFAVAYMLKYKNKLNVKKIYAAPFVQLPCCGVVSEFSTSAPELRYWLSGKNPLADYLCENTVREAERYKAGMAWTRVIWDVTAVAWLLNDNDRFMRSEVTDTFLPGYDFKYEAKHLEKKMRYVTSVNRDKLMSDLFFKLTDK